MAADEKGKENLKPKPLGGGSGDPPKPPKPPQPTE